MNERSASGRSRLAHVWERLYLSAAAGDTKAAMFIVEQTQGRAAGTDSLAFADHFRRVERDKIELAMRILGPRMLVMDRDKLVAFIEHLADNPESHVKAAEQFLRGEQRALTLPSTAEDDPAQKGEEPGDANG
jgi:hypothetical protein